MLLFEISNVYVVRRNSNYVKDLKLTCNDVMESMPMNQHLFYKNIIYIVIILHLHRHLCLLKRINNSRCYCFSFLFFSSSFDLSFLFRIHSVFVIYSTEINFIASVLCLNYFLLCVNHHSKKSLPLLDRFTIEPCN